MHPYAHCQRNLNAQQIKYRFGRFYLPRTIAVKPEIAFEHGLCNFAAIGCSLDAALIVIAHKPIILESKPRSL